MVLEPLAPPAGFDESTTSEWLAALLMFIPRLLSKDFGRINKLK
jgi:hypothetical protein